MSEENNDFQKSALHYHQYPKAGKLEIQATKTLGSQRDLALAYSPGVAAPCLAIAQDANLAAKYTAKGNLVGVVTNGSAVLGLGNIGALAAKPVMEGKAVLFKKFADIDVFDIEVNADEIDSFVNTVANLEPTFGGINLEDIKAPECFEIEAKLQEKLQIPVFHDDQHGTAIIVCAAILNALDLAKKDIAKVKIVTSGAGAAALACLNLLLKLGAKKENIWVTDLEGVVYEGRNKLMDKWKAPFAQDTALRKLEEVLEDADIFLGLSAADVLKPQWLEKMAKEPLILALANPNPEIMPQEASKVRPDAMICTGRSDYPNQVNNVLCFPYIFRGALDVGATAINEEMKIAAIQAIAKLAREIVPDNKFFNPQRKIFGKNYLIPSPFDQRLLLRIAPAVAKAAMDSKIALRPIEDLNLYIDNLQKFVYKSGLIMKPIFGAVKSSSLKKVIYSDGEDERVLYAAKVSSEEQIAYPILVGRKEHIYKKMQNLGINMEEGKDFSIYSPSENDHYEDYVNLYIRRSGRQGVSIEAAKNEVLNNSTVYAALAVMRGDADAMICGLSDRFHASLDIVKRVVGLDKDVKKFYSLSLLILPKNVLFFADTHINLNLTYEELADLAIVAASEIRDFGIDPKIALLSHSNFGSRENESTFKMRQAVELIKKTEPALQIDGEMNGDIALSKDLRDRVYPHSTLQSEANLLIFPNLDAANISLNIVKQTANALFVGPILLGAARSAHIVTPTISSRGILNMTAIAAFDARRKPL